MATKDTCSINGVPLICVNNKDKDYSTSLQSDTNKKTCYVTYCRALKDTIVENLFRESQLLMGDKVMERKCTFNIDETKYSDLYNSLALKWKENEITYEYKGSKEIDGHKFMEIHLSW